MKTSMATMNLEAKLSPVDSKEKVLMAIKEIFPNAKLPEIENSSSFPSSDETEYIKINDIDYELFFEKIHSYKIADTALDCMSQNIQDDISIFKISRQAALAGKIAFVLEHESPLGGCFELTIESTNVIAWIEEMTWHQGRDEVPRTVNDELQMRRDGAPQDWF
jgi:predicted RNA binding protein with dsRBD fold (UPF0201 family)